MLGCRRRLLFFVSENYKRLDCKIKQKENYFGQYFCKVVVYVKTACKKVKNKAVAKQNCRRQRKVFDSGFPNIFAAFEYQLAVYVKIQRRAYNSCRNIGKGQTQKVYTLGPDCKDKTVYRVVHQKCRKRGQRKLYKVFAP